MFQQLVETYDTVNKLKWNYDITTFSTKLKIIENWY